MKITRKAFIAGALGLPVAVAVKAAKLIPLGNIKVGVVDPYALGQRLIDTAMARSLGDDIHLGWVYGPGAVAHILRGGDSLSPFSKLGEGGYVCGRLGTAPDNCAILYGTKVTKAPPAAIAAGILLAAGQPMRVERIYCGMVNFETGEITYG